MTDADSRPPIPRPFVEPPSPDVDVAGAAPSLPGAPRGAFSRLPTAPVDVTIESASPEPGSPEYSAATAEWLMPPARTSRGLAGWALAFAIVGLLGSMLVGWAFPIGLVGVIMGIVALRSLVESRATAIWAIVLGAVSILYSAGWLLWAAGQANLLG